MNQAIVGSKGIVEKYLPLIESWEPKSNSLFINSMCKELIDYLEKNTTSNLILHDRRKAREKATTFTCENGQSVIISSEGEKTLIQFVKDLDSQDELKILLKNISEDKEKYVHSIIVFIGDTNPEMQEKLKKFIEINKIQVSLIKK